MKALRKILHVEDDPDIRAIVKLCLHDLGGFELLQCSTGHEALKVAENFDPDLFFLDMMMPGLNGLETLQALKSLQGLREVPAVFLTSVNNAEKYHDAILEQAAGSIQKPFDPSRLVDQLQQIWSQLPE
ncbi:response regulator [uncultured Shimia sp.]|uniref:response regulator n=1 Tax=uncultured Shimia sp. TaxID=573152 RepID=UPI002623FCDD|nr:response regulator [uncultured Shimia sp.]